MARDPAGRLLGLAHFRPMPRPLTGSTAGFLDDLFVAPAARGAGVGDAVGSGVGAGVGDGVAADAHVSSHLSFGKPASGWSGSIIHPSSTEHTYVGTGGNGDGVGDGVGAGVTG